MEQTLLNHKAWILTASLFLTMACGNSSRSDHSNVSEAQETSFLADLQSDDLVKKYVEHIKTDSRLNAITNFADMLGFGWAAGCPFVFGWTNNGTHFDIKQNVGEMDNCPYRGFWDHKRTAYKFHDFGHTITSLELKDNDEAISDIKDFSVGATHIVKNYSLQDGSANLSYTKSKKNALTTTTNNTLNIGTAVNLSTKVEVEAKANIFGSGGSVSASAGVNLGAQLSKSLSNGRSQSYWESDSFDFKQQIAIPPCTQQLIELRVFAQDKKIPFTAKVQTTSRIDITGFLRYTFHGNRKQGKDRPYVTATFGSPQQSISQHIVSEINTNDLVWDWNKIRQEYKDKNPSFDQISKTLSEGIFHSEEEISGTFIRKNQVRVEIHVKEEKKFNEEECKKGNGMVTSELQ